MNDFLENVTFNELTLGQQASLNKTLKQEDISLFAVMSGDINPAHMDPEFAKSDIFRGIVGHGMWSGSLISALLGTVLPGPGTIYLEQDIKFRKPVRIGDNITITLTVHDKCSDKPIVTFDCKGVNQRGEFVVEELAMVLHRLKKYAWQKRICRRSKFLTMTAFKLSFNHAKIRRQSAQRLFIQ